MSKYIDADKLITEIERLTNQKKKQLKMFSDEDYTCSVASSIKCELCGNEEVLSNIKSLQQEQETKFIEINGIRYKEVPAKTNDKICKDCDYFLDNGSCNFDDCPCTCDDNILERIQQEQPDVDLWKAARYVYESWMGGTMDDVRRDMIELGKVLNSRKEE